MILDLFSPNPFVVAGLTIGAVVLYYLILNLLIDRRVRKLGGVRAPVAGSTPFTSLWIFAWAARQHKRNNLLEYWDGIIDLYATPASPHCVEVALNATRRNVLTRDPEHIKAVLAGSKFAEYGKGSRFHDRWFPFLGNSIFATDGELWQQSRSLIRPMFITEKVRDLHIFDRWSHALISKIPASAGTIDICGLFYRMTLDTTTEYLLGHSVDSLNNPKNEFASAFQNVQRIHMIMQFMAPFENYVPKPGYKKDLETLNRFVEPFIRQALSMRPEELEKLSKSDKEFTFLHNIALFTRDPKVIRDQLMAILIAGRDTTAATLSWTIYELSHYPDVFRRLRTEVLNAIGPSQAPSYQDLKRMTFLTHALNETLRLYPAVPFNVRQALQDTSLPGQPGQPDIILLEGDVIGYSALAMQRQKCFYPPTSEKFADPAIWSPDRWSHWTPKPWTYVPFNGGPRICVGQNFAMTEMAFTMVRILQKFDSLEYRGDWYAQTIKAEVVSSPGDGVPVGLREARPL